MSKQISSDLVGMTFEPVEFTWDSKDVMLYAVGVGAKPEGELEFVYEGKGPRVLPTYAVIPGMFSMGGLVSNVEINLAMLLHRVGQLDAALATITAKGFSSRFLRARRRATASASRALHAR